MHALGEGRDRLRDVRGELRPGVELVRDGLGLLLCRELACHEQPEKALGHWLASGLRSREALLELWNRVAPEANALLCIQERGVPEHALDVASAA